MKKYIVSFLVASIFLAGAPFAVKQASASDLSIRDFVNLLIIIGVIPADKIPAVNAYLATLDNTTAPYLTTTPREVRDCPTGQVWSGSLHNCAIVTTTTEKPFVPLIKVLSPNGGESYKTGDTISIKFRSNIPDNKTPGTSLQLYRAQKGSPEYVGDIVKNDVNGSPYNWTIPNNLTPDLYYIYAAAPVTGISLPEGGVSDFSDDYFTISAPTTAQPSITSPNGGETIMQGQMLNVFWDSASPTQAVGISIVSSTGGIMQNFVQGVTPAGADYQSLGFTTSASTSSGRYIPVGQYKASVCSVASHQCDGSDNYFSIVTATN
jgi:hypothetical protein